MRFLAKKIFNLRSIEVMEAKKHKKCPSDCPKLPEGVIFWKTYLTKVAQHPQKLHLRCNQIRPMTSNKGDRSLKQK